MKYISLFSILFCNLSLIAQSCLSIGIAFNTQQDIDNFSTNYPGCSEVLGNVCIGDCSPPFDHSNILDLEGLAQLTSIGGYLWINANSSLNSLSGLDHLSAIGGDLSVRQNGLLPNLSSLDSLQFIGGGLDITGNSTLETIDALEHVQAIGGSIEIAGNVQLNSLTGLNQLTVINGYLRLINNPSIANLEALSNIAYIEGFLHLFSNNSLTDLNGLNQLTAIGDLLNIGHNSALASLSGLENLTTIGGLLNIETNNALLHLNALEQLTTIGGFLSIKNNASLSSLSGLDNIDPSTIVNLFIEHSAALSACEVNSICAYLETPTAFETSIIGNATGCNSINEVAEACGIVGTEELITQEDRFRVFSNADLSETVIFTVNPTPIFIYNSVGQLMKEIMTVQGNNVINLSVFPSGAYFFVTKNGLTTQIVGY